MQFSVVLPVLACILATVHANPYSETNAARLARGLPPNPPVRRSRTMVPNSKPSNIPGECNSGPVQCCNKVTSAGDPTAQTLTGLLGLLIPLDTIIGLECNPVSVIGASGSSCNSQTVCCSNNEFNGLIAIGCNPINL